MVGDHTTRMVGDHTARMVGNHTAEGRSQQFQAIICDFPRPVVFVSDHKGSRRGIVVKVLVAPIFRGWQDSVNGCHVYSQRWRGDMRWPNDVSRFMIPRNNSRAWECLGKWKSQRRCSKTCEDLQRLTRLHQARRDKRSSSVYALCNLVELMLAYKGNPRLGQARIKLIRLDKWCITTRSKQPRHRCMGSVACPWFTR